MKSSRWEQPRKRWQCVGGCLKRKTRVRSSDQTGRAASVPTPRSSIFRRSWWIPLRIEWDIQAWEREAEGSVGACTHDTWRDQAGRAHTFVRAMWLAATGKPRLPQYGQESSNPILSITKTFTFLDAPVPGVATPADPLLPDRCNWHDLPRSVWPAPRSLLLQWEENKAFSCA
jgi:hypothetical protein